MNQDKYFELLDKNLRQMFMGIKQRIKPIPGRRHHWEGFMHAGVVMGLISKDELEARMEGIHHEVFGMSIQQRLQSKAYPAMDEPDYDGYDSPTYVRQGLSG